MTYDLWYWDGLPGRGEFVRLALEAGKIPYRERAREKNADIQTDMEAERDNPPFAPPYLVVGEMAIAQTANILLFLGEEHGLAPADPAGRLWVNQLQLTIADLVAETHNVHHPISVNIDSGDQKAEAARSAEPFRNERIPKFLGYFEGVLESQGDWLAGGERWTYADLSLYQLIEGLLFAYPKRMAALSGQFAKVLALHERVGKLPELQDYLASDRRLPLGDGIFRHYPELDAA